MVMGVKKEKQSESEAPLITRHTISESRRSNTKLLLVEDNQTNKLVATAMLKKLGYSCDVAVNGQEAVEMLKTKPYDIVFMDMQMPVMNGLDATRAIRDKKSQVLNREIPIIAMTANAMKGDRGNCINAGMDDYIAKPIESEAIIRVLNKWLKSSESLESHGESGSHQRVTEEPKEKMVEQEHESAMDEEEIIFDKSGFLSRVGGDIELAILVFEAFRPDFPKQISDLKQAVESADVSTATRVVHSIKGAAANIGAEQIRSLAYVMEKAGEKGDLQMIQDKIPKLEQLFDIFIIAAAELQK